MVDHVFRSKNWVVCRTTFFSSRSSFDVCTESTFAAQEAFGHCQHQRLQEASPDAIWFAQRAPTWMGKLWAKHGFWGWGSKTIYDDNVNLFPFLVDGGKKP